jgi:hypothetical protein
VQKPVSQKAAGRSQKVLVGLIVPHQRANRDNSGMTLDKTRLRGQRPAAHRLEDNELRRVASEICWFWGLDNIFQDVVALSL